MQWQIMAGNDAIDDSAGSIGIDQTRVFFFFFFLLLELPHLCLARNEKAQLFGFKDRKPGTMHR
jgi:hypothetical protein